VGYYWTPQQQINTDSRDFFSTGARLLSVLTLRAKKKIFFTSFAQRNLPLGKTCGFGSRLAFGSIDNAG